jgi:uncharacterized protein
VQVFISLQELQLHNIDFDVNIPAGEIDYDFGIAQTSVLHSKGTARLLKHSLGEIRVAGKLSVTVDGSCDRCLKPAALLIDKDFDLVYMPSEQADRTEAQEVDAAAIEVGYYEGNGLALNDILREVVLLALPMRLICSESCKGICPVCGQDRNLRECNCTTGVPDERWQALEAFRSTIGHRH